MNTNTTSTVLRCWTAPERPSVQRGELWYATVGLLALGAAVWSILTAAWTLTVVIILAGALYYQHLRTHTPDRRIEIRKEGVAVNDELTLWEHCAGFWIYQHDDICVLHVEKNRGWVRELSTVIRDVDPRDVAVEISAFLPYRAARRENILDSIIRICKL